MDNLMCCKNICSFDAVKAVFNILDLWDQKPAEICFEAFSKEASPVSIGFKLELASDDCADYFYYDGSASSYLSFKIYARAICSDVISSQDIVSALYAVSDFIISFDFPYRFGNVILRCAELTKLPFCTFSGRDGSEEFCAEFGLHYFTQSGKKQQA